MAKNRLQTEQKILQAVSQILLDDGFPAVGRQTRWFGWVDLNLFDRIYFENWITHVKSREIETDLELFNGYQYGSRINYQYDRQLSLRIFVQYDNFGKSQLSSR